jgi:hypothetical protein
VTRVSISAQVTKGNGSPKSSEVVPTAESSDRGGSVGLNLRLQPYREGPQVESVRVRLPPVLRGPVTLTVRGGLTPPDGEDADAPPLLSFAELLTALEENVQSSELVSRPSWTARCGCWSG